MDPSLEKIMDLYSAYKNIAITKTNEVEQLKAELEKVTKELEALKKEKADGISEAVPTDEGH